MQANEIWTRVRRLLPGLLLWCAFLAFGVWMTQALNVRNWGRQHGPTELYGLDYCRYTEMLSHTRMIGYAAFRHPLYGWFLSPVILLGHRLCDTAGFEGFRLFLAGVFSAVMTGASLLVQRILHRLGLHPGEAWICTALFASFAAVWLLAACPESFGLSCLLALAVLAWGLDSRARAVRTEIRIFDVPVKSPTVGRKLDLAGWGLLALLTGGVTTTQGVKTVLAYLVLHRPSKRRTALLAGGILAAFVLLAGIFAVRMMLRNAAAGPGHIQTFATAWTNISSAFLPEGTTGAARLRYAWVFFSEPIVTRGEPFAVNHLVHGYSSLLPQLLVGCTLACAAIGVWCGRHTVLVKMIGAMFLLDFALHFVLFWGMEEAQIYAGHWLHAVPLLAGCTFLKLTDRARFLYGAFLLALAALVLTANIRTLFGV